MLSKKKESKTCNDVLRKKNKGIQVPSSDSIFWTSGSKFGGKVMVYLIHRKIPFYFFVKQVRI
jgi:hypothetical protein